MDPLTLLTNYYYWICIVYMDPLTLLAIYYYWIMICIYGSFNPIGYLLVVTLCFGAHYSLKVFFYVTQPVHSRCVRV